MDFLDPGKAGSAPKAQTIRMPIQPMDKHKEKSRIEKFEALINANSTDLGKRSIFCRWDPYYKLCCTVQSASLCVSYNLAVAALPSQRFYLINKSHLRSWLL